MPSDISLAQAAEADPVRTLASYLIFPAVILIWWLLLFRPQRQQERQHKETLAALKAGDKVVTTGGIYGVVQQVGERTLRIKIADNVKIEVSRSAIAGLQPKED